MGRLPRLARLAPSPRAVDWGIFALLALELASGILAWTGWAWVPAALAVDVHVVGGLALVPLLAFKFARVGRRVTDADRWDRATPVSVLLGVVAVAAVATGVFWTAGGNVFVLAWTTLSVHVGLGLLVVPLLVVHLAARVRPPARTDASRRNALRVMGTLAAGAVVWRAQETVAAALETAGARRRETGSKPIGSLAETDTVGGEFPVTSWVADDPDPVDTAEWSLSVSGRVSDPLELGFDELDATRTAERRATLDCTSGWYTVQDWHGVRLGDLLDAAGVDDDARFVRVRSVTGYRWSFPLPEARDMFLATHVGDERLTHGHGAPLRLVAPGRRGFQWVKWVEAVELRRRGDPAQWLVTLVSGL